MTAYPRGSLLLDPRRAVAALQRWVGSAVALLALVGAGCAATTDSLGADAAVPAPSTFEEVLGESPTAVSAKLGAAYDQLFHGDPADEAIFFEAPTGGAYIRDIFHGDIRTDGLGYGLLLAVSLDRHDDFDALWTYAKSNLMYATGPRAGLLFWACDGGECPDPNGMSFAATALLFASHRWTTGDHDYAADSRALRDALLHQEAKNGGVVEDVHDSFDDATGLVLASPIGSFPYVIPAYLLPAFYGEWAKDGPDAAFWQRSATASRAMLAAIAHPATGLTPEQTTLGGVPLADRFASDAYRVGFNMALDGAWSGAEVESAGVLDRLVTFFAPSAPFLPLGEFNTVGEPLVVWGSPALAACNGAAAGGSTAPGRDALIQLVWDLPVPTGVTRYYDGMLYLLGLAFLSGALVPY